MKTNNKSAKTTKSARKSFAKYSDKFIAQLCAFLKTHTNRAAKAKFKCSAHFAGKIRRAKKIAQVAPNAAALL